MARKSNDPNSATSQFFIMHGDAPYLDGDYAAFGKLIEGYDVLDKIANTPLIQIRRILPNFPFPGRSQNQDSNGA